MIYIDGSRGEGGGQVLRTSLALSIVTGQPVRIDDIRANRAKPGLMRQHLTAVRAAQEISGAEVEGAALRSRTLTFRPGPVRGGTYCFSVGTAGSACLVFQTVLPPLLVAGTPSRITFEGGTHNPMAPPYHYLARVFGPLVARMGPGIELDLERWGFYPVGGGRFTARIEPAPLRPIELCAAGEVDERRALAAVARLPRHIAERELVQVQDTLGWSASDCEVCEVPSPGPGNVVMLELSRGGVREMATAIGEKGKRAERVAAAACAALRGHEALDVPVGEHLADQLMLPMALAGAGAYRTGPLSLHARTNLAVIGQFLDVRVTVTEDAGQTLVRFGR